MSNWIYQLVNLSLTSAVVVVIVLAARLLLRRMPKKYSYFLWGAVFLRAVCPVSFTLPVSLLSLFSFRGTGNGRVAVALEDYQAARLSMIMGWNENQAAAAGLENLPGEIAFSGTAAAEAGLGPGFDVSALLFGIWILGLAGLLIYALVSYFKLHGRVAAAVRSEDGIYESDRISTAFVLGFFRPRIYLPKGLSAEGRQYVCAHEREHLRYHDHQIKMLAWLVTAVHWFNPFLWLAFTLMVRDMEMSCDERVLDKLGEENKSSYGSFLLNLAAPKHFPAGSPLAFGESAVKTRIKNVLRYRKAPAWAAFGAFILSLVTFAACMTNPQSEESINIIGGADGPTSIFLAGKLGAGAASENSDFPEEFQGVLEYLDAWAEAVAARDAETAYGMLSPKLQERASELGIFIDEDGTKSMGWSSPFAVEGMQIPVIVRMAGETCEAEILYPAMTSDPFLWVWKDELTLEKQGKGYQVTGWEQKEFFDITSMEECREAYENWMPDYAGSLEDMGSFAGYLQEHCDSEDAAGNYSALLEPVKALEATLHFSGGEGEIIKEGKGEALISYAWPDGKTEVQMIQPQRQGEGGIWTPESITFQE